MILKDEKLDALIAEHEKKAVTAYRNYQDSGNGRYWSTYKRHEDIADTLKVARDGKEKTQLCAKLQANVVEWAGVISKMPYMADDRREEETKRILSEIIALAAQL